MRKKTILLLFNLFLLINVSYAAAEDTFRVKSHDKVIIKTDPSRGQTFYNEWAVFPKNQDYRKVYLELTFECAPGLRCGEWDYLNDISINRINGKNGDSIGLEIARFITPYGFYWTAAGKWLHKWRFDLSQYSNLFKDSIEISYRHSGYEANNDRGWQITLDFNCIAGTPARNPIGLPVKILNRASFTYGDDNSPINDKLPIFNSKTPANAMFADVQLIQTGHGADRQEGCSEFCSKTVYMYNNGQKINQKTLWRNDCGLNSLYPQAGTWLLDRGNWCPGAGVTPISTVIGLKNDSAINYQMQMEPYSNNAGSNGNYYITSHILYFGAFNFKNDVSIEDIINPSTFEDYKRYNPSCGDHRILIKNNGSDTVKSVRFKYGNTSATKNDFIWFGTLSPLQVIEIILPAVTSYKSGMLTFDFEILNVNGKVDENTFNNKISSRYVQTPTHVKDIIIEFITNNEASENSIIIKDWLGAVVWTKNDFENSTTYRETLNLKNGYCYTLILDDKGTSVRNINKDGIGWWFGNGQGTTNGVFRIRNAANNSIIKNFATDFGTELRYEFTTGFPLTIEDIPSADFVLYPNPASNSLRLSLGLIHHFKSYSIFNNLGQVVDAQLLDDAENEQQIDISKYHNGIYFITCVGIDGIKTTKKFVVLKN